MAYDTNNLRLIAQGTAQRKRNASGTLLSNGGALWFYHSTDAVAAVRVSGYISDGDARGLVPGDLVFVVDTDASPITVSICIVTSVAAGGAADLSDGTAITATDTD